MRAASNAAESVNARRLSAWRAFTLLELLVVLTIVGILSGMAASRFGEGALQQTAAEGYVRRLALDLRLARRASIATGDVCRLSMTSAAGNVVAYRIFRQAAGGDIALDESVATPPGVTVTSDFAAWCFDFDGALTAASPSGAVRVDAPKSYWIVTLYGASGSIETARFSQP